MKREFVLLLALCAFAAAMVPRERRAVDSEAQTPTTEEPRRICAHSTPCGWSFYNGYSKIIEMDVINTYCDCGEGLTCQIYEDDQSVNSYVKRCKIPSVETEITET